ncbi:MAG: F0F1 ATP synthase subunit B, partial [Myxococcales bacterium]|nr:F0F1 ATP synthase subunit B [Myxococcales bacterium]
GGRQRRPAPGTSPNPALAAEVAAHGAPAHGAGHAPGAGGAHECPGHGPNDRPPEVNWLHGILGVDNEGAPDPLPPNASGWDRFLWKLKPSLWRYENKDDACDPRNEPIPLFANLVNFGIFAFLLVHFGKKPVREALAKRKASIMTEIDRAASIRSEAKKRLEHYRGELENLDDTLAELREQFHDEGKAEELRLVEEMGSMRDRMLADAEFRAAQDGKTARDELSRQALEGALRAAESLIGQTITPADHDRLVETYLDHLAAALKSGVEVRA